MPVIPIGRPINRLDDTKVDGALEAADEHEEDLRNSGQTVGMMIGIPTSNQGWSGIGT
jgi:hypothetical protein